MSNHSLEEIAAAVAQIAFTNNWKEDIKTLMKLHSFKKQKSKLKSEILIFLYFTGDMGIVAAIKDQLQRKTLRDYYRRLWEKEWEKFIGASTPSTSEKMEIRWNGYLKAMEDYDNQYETKPVAWYMARYFCSTCDAEAIDTVMISTKIFHDKLIAISGFLKENTEEIKEENKKQNEK